MRHAIARAQRAEAVRAAARSWTAAGLIDTAAAAAIPQLYPDDRVRVGRAARVLFFLFTALAALALFGWLLLLTDGIAGGGAGQLRMVTLALGFGLGTAALAELLSGSLRRAQTGAEEAAAFLAVGFLFLAAERILSGEYGVFEHPLALARVTAVFCALAAWRWGGAVFGAATATALFLSVSGLPAARWLWILGSAALLLPLLRIAESIRWAPTQRRAAAAALCVALAAGYGALHPSGAVDPILDSVTPTDSFESFEGHPAARASTAWVVPDLLARAGIVLVPLALLVAGVRSRRRLLLDMGLILAVLSATWLSHDAGWGPPWLLLLAGGAVAMATAMAARRYLDAGEGHERHGLTAAVLAGESTAPGTLELAAALATLAPAARTMPPSPVPELQGDGGEFGGGGASSSF